MEEVKVRSEGKYVRHNVKANRSVDLLFKMPYSELTNYIQTIQMLNENVTVGVRISSEKPMRLGSFMINKINIDNDGEGTITLNSQIDFIDMNAINELAARNDEPLVVMFRAKIDLEEEEIEE